jgi:hypothetical protein
MPTAAWVTAAPVRAAPASDVPADRSEMNGSWAAQETGATFHHSRPSDTAMNVRTISGSNCPLQQHGQGEESPGHAVDRPGRDCRRCEEPRPPQKGLQDTLLTALFQDLLSEKVLPGDAYTAQELLAFLGVGVHVGAVGGSVPGNLGQTAKNLFVEFEAALDIKLTQAIAEGNVPTIIDILIGAQQFGLDSLAAKAQGALATVGGP